MTNLARMLVAYEQKYDLSAVHISENIGIDDSTYCRIKTGKMPSGKNMVLLIAWMVFGND